ncbi:MAG: UrcA family protein [Halieaceae bacterium]|jgi:UrcA family protein|nr:UrcA family protein [Halieaceae bacterium]
MSTFSLSRILCAAVFTVTASGAMADMNDNVADTATNNSTEKSQTLSVSYADLDLSTAESRETLQTRVMRAARKVCGSTSYRVNGSLRQAADNRSCYNNAVADAMRQVSSEQVASATR